MSDVPLLLLWGAEVGVLEILPLSAWQLDVDDSRPPKEVLGKRQRERAPMDVNADAYLGMYNDPTTVHWPCSRKH